MRQPWSKTSLQYGNRKQLFTFNFHYWNSQATSTQCSDTLLYRERHRQKDEKVVKTTVMACPPKRYFKWRAQTTARSKWCPNNSNRTTIRQDERGANNSCNKLHGWMPNESVCSNGLKPNRRRRHAWNTHKVVHNMPHASFAHDNRQPLHTRMQMLFAKNPHVGHWTWHSQYWNFEPTMIATSRNHPSHKLKKVLHIKANAR